MPVRVDHGVTSGTFTLDGETFDVDNNVWVIGDDTECIVIDAPHSVDGILAVTADRKVKAIVCTHAHDDHVRAAPALRAETAAPILLHPDDRPLWELTHGGPGATGRSYSDRPTLEASIRAKLFTLPDDTIVHTGHGQDTTTGAEKALLG